MTQDIAAKILAKTPGARRVEVIGACRLYLGDCVEILPRIGKVDAVLTDPPYGISLKTDNRRFTGGHTGRGNGVGSAGGRPIVNDGAPFDPSHLTKYGLQQIVFGWNNFAEKLPRGSALIWIKRNEAAYGSFLSDAEIAWFSEGHGVYCFKDLSNNSNAKDRVHPTQKPIPLMGWCLSKLAGKTILDPYMGSGSTGVACVRAGRAFVGIEIDDGYFDAACERIRQAYAVPDMFVAPADPDPVQGGFL